MVKIPLTAAQIKAFDEIGVGKSAAELTLKLAMAYHSNRLNEIIKVERDLWKDLAEIHALNPSIVHTLAQIDGQVVITEKED